MNTPHRRSQAIDVLRGLTVALMIMANMPGSPATTYAPFLHTEWHGLTLTDLVFPTFLFVVGTALSFTLEKYQGMGEAAVLRKIFTRTALIFLCGFLLYWFPFVGFDGGSPGLLPFSGTRVFGVLQRIALGYCAASLLLHYAGERGAIAFAALALLGYWALMAAFGDYTLLGNAQRKLDLLVLGEAHMYHGEGIAFDPEGILSTLPAIVNVLGGYFAGRLVRRLGAGYETIARLMMAGAVLAVLALAWSGVFPLNKKLWTSSYALLCIAIDLGALSLLLYVIDMRGYRGWTYFFEVLGRNTLFIYLLSEVVATLFFIVKIGGVSVFDWVYLNLFRPWAGAYNGTLLWALFYMLGCWMVGYVLDRKKIYIKL
nr:heparan-alpha-glucosaminide N-acetyltransferase domain-containing protein [uncultured Duganella sp.]